MTIKRHWVSFIGAALAMFAAGCDRKHSNDRAAIAPLAFTNEGRIAAMVAIHANAYWPDGPPPALELKTASLDDAVRLLKADPDPFAVSRRRRAIAKLAAYGLGHPNIDRALEQLGAHMGVIKAVFEERGGLLEPRSAFAQSAAPIPLGPSERETAAFDAHADLSLPNCKTKRLLNWAGNDGSAASAASSIWVDRDVADVAKALDPQSWDQCSKFFADTHLARPNPSDPKKPIVVPAIPAGQAYPTQTMFERFECATPGCDAWFENLLFVTTWYSTTPNGQKYSASYGFDTWLAGRALNQDRRITADDGELWARKDPNGGSIVDTSKNISFDSPGFTGLTQAALAHSEMAGELAELVCCGVGVTPPVLPVVK